MMASLFRNISYFIFIFALVCCSADNITSQGFLLSEESSPGIINGIPIDKLELPPKTYIAPRDGRLDGSSGTATDDFIITHEPPVLPTAITGSYLTAVFVECETSFKFNKVINSEFRGTYSELSCQAGRYLDTRNTFSFNLASYIKFFQLPDFIIDPIKMNWELIIPSKESAESICTTNNSKTEFTCDFPELLNGFTEVKLTITDPSIDLGQVISTGSAISTAPPVNNHECIDNKGCEDGFFCNIQEGLSNQCIANLTDSTGTDSTGTDSTVNPSPFGVCSNGIPGTESNGVCCSLSCGETCGGAGCDSLPGGAEGCCTSRILDSGRSCSDTQEAPCIINN